MIRRGAERDHGPGEGNAVRSRQALPSPQDRVPDGTLPPGKERLAVGEAHAARSHMAAEPPERDPGAVTSPPLLGNYWGLDSRSSVSETAPRRSASLASAARRCASAEA